MEGGSAATVASIISAASTAFTTMSNDAMTMIATVVPIGLGILGAIVVIKIGIKVFKTVTGR